MGLKSLLWQMMVSRECQSTPEHSGEHTCFADTLFFCLTQSTLEHSGATILALAAPEALGALEHSGVHTGFADVVFISWTL